MEPASQSTSMGDSRVIPCPLDWSRVNDHQFKHLIAASVLLSLALMVWNDSKNKKIDLPDYAWFAALFGIVGGFATMILIV